MCEGSSGWGLCVLVATGARHLRCEGAPVAAHRCAVDAERPTAQARGVRWPAAIWLAGILQPLRGIPREVCLATLPHSLKGAKPLTFKATRFSRYSLDMALSVSNDLG